MESLSVEQQIMEQLRNLDDAQKRRVLNYVHTLQPAPSLSARDLLHLPPDERDRLVAAAFEAAADEDFEVFEAYSEDDLDA
jgi:hypothetical protein